MKKSLAHVGNSPYHHHFHNPIVGMNEGDFRYNSKWRINNTDFNLSSEHTIYDNLYFTHYLKKKRTGKIIFR
jgi:hypothetical protein